MGSSERWRILSAPYLELPGGMASAALSTWYSSSLSRMRHKGKGRGENNVNRSTCRGNCTRGTKVTVQEIQILVNY